jgi:hypothetical protein
MQPIYRYLSAFLLAVLFTLNAGLADALNLYVKSDTVNVRSGPSTSASILTKVKYRQAVSHLGKSGDFYKVKTTSGTVGYIYAPLVSTTVPPVRVASRPAAAAPVAQQGYTVWINTNSGVYHNSGCRWYGNTNSGTYANVNNAWGRACQKCGG